MKNKLQIKKCENCGALVKILKDCTCENCGLQCCGKQMKELLPNTFEASAEKHIPTYERVEDEIFVKINHPMEKEHYIEWISLVKDNKEETIHLYPEENAEVRFKYIKDSTIYAFCNKHELWSKNVD